MKLAHYWTRQTGEAIGPMGERIRVVSRGWSNESIQQAAAVARDVASRVAQRIASGETKNPQQYQYGDRPLPEPIVREPGPGAVITRNMYGALVLNTETLMFVDIDRDDRPQHSAQIQRVVEANNLSARLYRTAAGYRVLITNAAFQAASPQTEGLLKQFQADPLYIRLCSLQQSFRARLTPKPWRVGMPVPPVSFPFETPQQQAQFREWETRYNNASAGFATCRYLTSFGGVRIAPEFEELVFDHDMDTKATSPLPLA